MNAKTTTRLVREGELAAEVDVTLIEADEGWTPYLSIEDAYRLDVPFSRMSHQKRFSRPSDM